MKLLLGLQVFAAICVVICYAGLSVIRIMQGEQAIIIAFDICMAVIFCLIIRWLLKDIKNFD